MTESKVKQLSPTQQQTVEQALTLSSPGSVVVIQSAAGQGRSTIIRDLQQRLGGRLLTSRDFVLAQLDNHPFKFEEAIFRLLSEAFQSHQVVLIDDFDLVMETANNYESQRCYFVNLVLRAITEEIIGTARRLLIIDSDEVPWSLQAWSHMVKVPELARADREFLFRGLLPEAKANAIDFDELFRFAQHLDCRQISLTCAAMHRDHEFSTAKLIEFVRRYRMDSNVDLRHVQQVSLEELKGLDDVLEALRIHLLTPLKNSALARDLNLRPKRGIMLHGPPGTGKTSIGRALAHELGAKFFLIDGEFNEQERFMPRVRAIFNSARENAPSVVFIDDSDVLLKRSDEDGDANLYRYLLAHLDGLHTEKDADVCVVMTAMEISHLPSALLRSGRIELWLEVKLPERAARLEILQVRCDELRAKFGNFSLDAIADITDSFSGADLRRLVDDAKNLIGHQLLTDGASIDVVDRMLEAAETINKGRARYKHGPSGLPAGFRAARVA